MKNGFKFEVTEGCTEITPDGEKEKLRQRLLISMVRCCCIEQNPAGFQCINVVTLAIVPVICKSENASFHSSEVIVPEDTKRSTTQF